MEALKCFFTGQFLYSPILYDNFFTMVNQINSSKNKNEIQKSNKARYLVYFIQTIYFVYTIFALVQMPFYHLFSDTVQFCFCNYFYFEGMPHIHWIWLIANSYVLMYLNYLMFFCNNGATFSLLQKVFRNQPNNTESIESIENFFVHSSHRVILQKNVHVVQFIKNRLLPLARFYQVAFNWLSSIEFNVKFNS